MILAVSEMCLREDVRAIVLRRCKRLFDEKIEADRLNLVFMYV